MVIQCKLGSERLAVLAVHQCTNAVGTTVALQHKGLESEDIVVGERPHVGCTGRYPWFSLHAA